MHDTALRNAVAAVDREISNAASPALLEPWNALRKLLALGPEPEVRDCPSCHHAVMAAATLCGHCWTRLVPRAA